MKMIKLSLVAAVAVAGLTTTSSAANLEDAIKGTKLTGYVRYRLNTTHDDGAANVGGNANEEAKIVAKITTKVNDSVTANVKTVSLADTSKGQTNADTGVYEGNFVVKAGGATVIAGLQTTQSPFAANNGDTRSHGVTALVPAGPVTVAAAHYTTTVAGSTVVTEDISALGAIAKLGVANVEAWYADKHNSKTSVAALLASAKVGPAKVAFHHADKDDGTSNENTNTQLSASMKAAGANVMVAYATTGKNSGDVTLDGDTDSKLIYALEGLSTKSANLDAVVVGAKMPVGPVSVGVDYLIGSADITTDATYAASTYTFDTTTGTSTETKGALATAASTKNEDISELKLSVAYKMSKNFGASAWYSAYEIGSTDYSKSRIEVKYTF